MSRFRRRSYAATAGASVRQGWLAQQAHCPHCGEVLSHNGQTIHDPKNCPALSLRTAITGGGR